LTVKSGFSGCYPTDSVVNSRDQGAYSSKVVNKSLDSGVIKHLPLPSSQPPRLLDQLRETFRLKHFSLKTEKSYIHYVRDFILFHNKRHPKDMEVDEIRAYQSLEALLQLQLQKTKQLHELDLSMG